MPNIEALLADAIEIADEPSRRKFVEQASGGDAEMRRELERLVELPLQEPVQVVSLDIQRVGGHLVDVRGVHHVGMQH